MMLLSLARVVIRVLGWLPLAVLHRLAVLPGLVLRVLPWKKHAIIKANLALCFPDREEDERRQLHHRYLVELFRLVFEAGALWHWSRERIERHVDIVEGQDVWQRIREDDRATLLVSAHLGNWELLNLYLSQHLPLATLYRAPSDPILDAFINLPRERFGARMVAGNRAALRQLLIQLRSGQMTAIAADIQPKRGDGLFVPLFGVPALTMTLANNLARRTGCRVVYAWAGRRPDGKGWELSLIEADDRIQSEDPEIALGSMNEWLERAIRQAPEQYLWLYKRFSKRPDGMPPRYFKKGLGG